MKEQFSLNDVKQALWLTALGSAGLLNADNAVERLSKLPGRLGDLVVEATLFAISLNEEIEIELDSLD